MADFDSYIKNLAEISEFLKSCKETQNSKSDVKATKTSTAIFSSSEKDVYLFKNNTKMEKCVEDLKATINFAYVPSRNRNSSDEIPTIYKTERLKTLENILSDLKNVYEEEKVYLQDDEILKKISCTSKEICVIPSNDERATIFFQKQTYDENNCRPETDSVLLLSETRTDIIDKSKLQADSVVPIRTYKPGVGTIDLGRDFESKVAALMGLRYLNQQTKHFEMGINVNGCHPFDDLVIRKEDQEGKITNVMIQLKHQVKANDVRYLDFYGKTGNFSIFKYYSDYKKLLKNDSEGIIQDILKEGDTYFVLFTNRAIHEECCFLTPLENDSLTLLNTNEKCMYKVNYDSFVEEFNIMSDFILSVATFEELNNKLKSENFINPCHSQYIHNSFNTYKEKLNQLHSDIRLCLETLSEQTFRDFIDKLVVFGGQISQKGLDELITKEIQVYSTSDQNLNMITNNYLKYINDWSIGQLTVGHYFITKTFIRNHLADLLLQKYINAYYQFEYKDNNRLGLWEKIVQDQNIILVKIDQLVESFLLNYVFDKINETCKVRTINHAETWTTILSSDDKNKITTNLKDSEVFEELERSFNLNTNLTLLDLYRCLWKVRKVHLILRAKNIKEYESILHTLGHVNCNLPVIILINEKTVNLSSNLPMFTNLSSVTNEVQNEIFNISVKFQDKDLQLGQVFNINALRDKITVRDIIAILVNKFSIGNRLNQLPKFYVEQTLTKTTIDSTVLRYCKSDVFILYCSCEHLLKDMLKNVKYINYSEFVSKTVLPHDCNIILTEMDCFDYILKNIKGMCIHELHLYLQENQPILELVKTERGIQNIRVHISDLKVSVSSSRFIENLKSKFCIVSSGPGMGKTTLADYISHQIKPDTWVLTIDLKLYLDYYNSTECKINNEDPLQHLIHFNNIILSKNACDNEINRTVYQNFLESNRVFTIFDGYDEVSTTYEKEVTDMIKSLYNNNCKILLTTRPIMERHVEDTFHTLSISLNTFTFEDQVSFLNEYFVEEINRSNSVHSKNLDKIVEEQRIGEFVDKLLELTKRNLNDWELSFTGIPLQCRLLAEVFHDNCKIYVSTGKLNFNENFDLLYLYEKFVKAKLAVLHSKYGHYEKEFHKIVRKVQQTYALKIIFPENLVNDLNIDSMLQDYNRIIENVTSLIQKDGIIVVSNEFNINFAHRTFAEYFVAKWLSENFTTSVTANKLIRIIFEERYYVVRNIFDRILAQGCKLHLAIINKVNCKVISEIIEENRNIVKEVDRGGRSALHLVAIGGQKHPMLKEHEVMDKYKHRITNKRDVMLDVCKLLLEYDAGNEKDKLLGYNALDYSILNNTWSVGNVICEVYNDVNVKITSGILHVCMYYYAMYEYSSILDLLITKLSNSRYSSAVFLNYIKEYYIDMQYKPLHLSCSFDTQDITKYLVLNGADTNIKNSSGYTPLLYSVVRGYLHTVIYLVQNGANIHSQDNDFKNTPLLEASLYGRLNIVKYLVLSGAIVNVQNRNGSTPLHLTCNPKLFSSYSNPPPPNLDVAKYLVEMGADVNIKNNKGQTPLQEAEDPSIIEYLKSLVDNR